MLSNHRLDKIKSWTITVRHEVQQASGMSCFQIGGMLLLVVIAELNNLVHHLPSEGQYWQVS